MDRISLMMFYGLGWEFICVIAEAVPLLISKGIYNGHCPFIL